MTTASPRITAALIVKNEETHLASCLASLRGLGPLLAEVVVYDTGSTDRTVEIAEEFGATVQRGYWDGDFARARNCAIDMATSSWVLSIDADERFTGNPVALADVLRRLDRERPRRTPAVTLVIQDIRQDRELQSHECIRLFRPDMAHFVSAIHESVVTRDGSAFAPVKVGRDVLALRHLGYGETAKQDARWRRNAEIAQRVIRDSRARGDRDTPELVKALVDHARTVREMGQVDLAIEELYEVRDSASFPLYRAFGLEILTDLLCDCGRLDESRAVLAELRKGDLSPRDYCDWLLVRQLLVTGGHERALGILRRLDVVRNCLDVVAQPRLLLDARFKAALASREYLEAAACLVELMARHGDITAPHAELLLKLSVDISPEGLAELILSCGRRHLTTLTAELRRTGSRGTAVADALSRRQRNGISFGISADSAPIPA